MPVVTTTVLTLFANVLRKLWPFEVDQNFINIDTALQGKAPIAGPGVAQSFTVNSLFAGAAAYAPNMGGKAAQFSSGGGWAYVVLTNGNSANSAVYLGGASGLLTMGSVTDAGAIAEWIRFDGSGAVLVGSPTNNGSGAKLQVAGNGYFGSNGASPTVTIGRTDGYYKTDLIGSTGADGNEFQIKTGGVKRLAIKTDGTTVLEGPVIAPSHSTISGATASTASGAAVTILSCVGAAGVYLVTAWLNNSGANQHATALVVWDGTYASVQSYGHGGFMTLVVAAGSYVQAAQTTGVNQVISYSILKIS